MNELSVNTHTKINRLLCGTPQSLSDGASEVALVTTVDMAVDENGLIHGGFVFGLADYAAMLAVNHPFVVLSASNCRFLKPSKPGEHLLASAKVTAAEGKKRTVEVFVTRGSEKIFSGEFICAVLDKHVLA
ncbi:MAG: PaaI family thioesterase [Leptospirales bacterium]|nr:PaaI family thioesterase [Leptospirales bacterium]